MRYLGLALFAEGVSDHRFLSPILRRTCEEICLQQAVEPVEIGGVHELHSPPDFKEHNRASRIHEAARRAADAFHILFVHTDGQGDPGAAREERIEPAVRRMAEDGATRFNRTVAVVPVRETEAWALVDGAALRGAFGAEVDDPTLGVPAAPREVERIADPKQALNQAYEIVVGGRRRRKKAAADFLGALGERVRLDRIREVPAFQCFESDLRAALLCLGYVGVATS